jgi:ATP-dependent Zn protease
MARGKRFQRVVSAACTAGGCLAVGFSVTLLVIAALAYPDPHPKILTTVRRDAYGHNNISYVETQRNRWKVWSSDGDYFYYANAPAKDQATRLAMEELFADGIKFEPQPSTWFSRSIAMVLTLLGVVPYIIASLATLGALYHYYYEIYKKKHTDFSIEPQKPDPEDTAAAGLFDEKRKLKLALDFLKDPVVFESKGRRPPKGVLLAGPPGNGKLC